MEKKICFLIGDYVPHQVFIIRTLLEKYDVEINAYHVARYNKYIPELGSKFSTENFRSSSVTAISQEITNFNPDLIVVAGWMIPKYVRIAKILKNTLQCNIVGYSDTPWYGTFRQKVHSLFSHFHTRKAFTHLWVSGIRQYEYARRLGFANEQIIFNALCGDTETFSKVIVESKNESFPKNFIFIGRFEEVKGLRNLMTAWDNIQDKNGWTFTLIGDGILKKELKDSNNFIVKNYMTQEKLICELQYSGCFVLPSLREPWALVIHEATIAGLPIICTKTCGASDHFVINKYNGFKVQDNSVEDLTKKLKIILELSEEELIEMGHRSKILSKSITPELQTASLLQLLK